MDDTRWLDGVRGAAAAIVCVNHLYMGAVPAPHRGYGSYPPEENNYWFQLPPFRIAFEAHACVAIFMVVSGISISWKALHLRSEGRKTELLSNVSSSMLRRGIRLYLPVVAISVISQVVLYLDWYKWQPAKVQRDKLPNVWSHVIFCARYILSAIDVFGLPFDDGLNPQLWTIPLEYRGSLAVYTYIIALQRSTSRYRRVVLALILFWLYYRNYWDLAGFTAGLLMADISVRPTSDLQTVEQKPRCTPTRRSSSAVTAMLLVTGIYLFCSSDSVDLPPGYGLLAWFEPSTWKSQGDHADPQINPRFMWKTIGAASLVFALIRSPSLQIPFRSRFLQYLGRISYGIYCVHQLVYRCLRERVRWWAFDLLGNEYGVNDWLSWIITATVCWPIILKLGEWFTTFIDKPSQSIAKRMEAFMTRHE
ncbi:hypothetical protein CAC42_1939 [Sphaceloma murrayae]|uniref:Acyltransferase 3 domain-containing protein n=1 Tax=Sphaceloma murrayae TaxID=2082308 RepID=A0A2K1QLZ4_9PEZI|nr:hypothetical protein CAC42_1939 [Sphaceloma murrayae]